MRYGQSGVWREELRFLPFFLSKGNQKTEFSFTFCFFHDLPLETQKEMVYNVGVYPHFL